MLTFTELSGSPYHIGLALGKFGAVPVHDALTSSSQWAAIMQWRGSEQALAMQQLVQQHHPYIWDELNGLARGLELPPEDVFLWNCRGDLLPFDVDGDIPHASPTKDDDSQGPNTRNQYIAQSIDPDWCGANESTTILSLTDQGPRVTHNQGGIAGLADHCGVAEVIVDQGPAFASFICPGSLPGHTFAVTEQGLAITVNAVCSKNPALGIPSRVVARALLNAHDLSSVVQLLNNAPRSGVMHLSVAQRGGSVLLSIECNATDVSIQPVKAPQLHTNHLTHDAMQAHAQVVTASSRQRLDNGSALLDNPDDAPLRILADQTNRTHPICREINADEDTAERTVASVDMRVGTDAVDWDIYEHPNEPPRFRMRDAKHI